MNSIFGLNNSFEESKLVIIPVPWDVTSSYNSGSAQAISKIQEASHQIDLFDLNFKEAYKKGIHLLDTPKDIEKENKKLRKCYLKIQKKLDPIIQYIEILESFFYEENKQKNFSFYEDTLLKLYEISKGKKDLKYYKEILHSISKEEITNYNFLNEFSDIEKEQRIINEACEKVKAWVFSQSISILSKDKIPVVLGGDHSCPIGSIEAVSDKYQGDFGVLHIDAHYDLRANYQGLKYSHASFLSHVLKLKTKNIVSLGLRDFSKNEFIESKKHSKLHTFFDEQVRRKMFEGVHWSDICDEMIDKLPENIYISCDIDGLSLIESVNTGTPVPGGLSFNEFIFLLHRINKKGKKVIGFDLCEVGLSDKHQLNEIVGMRLLYKMSLLSLS